MGGPSPRPVEDEALFQEWLAAAEAKLRAWEPSPLNDILATERRQAYQSLISDPDKALQLLEECLLKAKARPALPYHIQNVEAPGGCWESGTQIVPSKTRVAPPEGEAFVIHTYRLVFILSRALVLDEDDHVRHLCNNRACIRPDHLEVGSAQQNRQDEERRKYAGNSPHGRGQTLQAHVPKTLQLRPDPWVPEPLEREE
jgi:hypothetical protein